MCHMFEQFAGRGAIVLVASGNNGVGAGNCQVFHVEFPSSCTWDVCYSFQSPHKCVAHQSIIFAGPGVTSVGGTQGQHPEVATPSSGSGFSYYFERPLYQDDAVPDFLYTAG